MKQQRGFTLPEVLISVGILSGIVAMSTQYMLGSWSVQSQVQTQAKLKTNSEKGLNLIARHLSQSQQLFSRGSNYVQKLDLSKAPSPVSHSHLPDILTKASLSPEKNCTTSPSEYFVPYAVGNSLLFASGQEPLRHSFTVSGNTALRTINIYRFNYAYITDNRLDTKHLTRPQVRINYWSDGDALNAQNLIFWRSVPVADEAQLRATLNYLDSQGLSGEKNSLIAALTARGVSTAWRKGVNNANSAFYTFNGSNLTAAGNQFKLSMQAFEDALRLQNTSGEIYSIAYNRHPDEFPIQKTVPFYYRPTLDEGCDSPPTPPAFASNPNSPFPGGFEVNISGPQSGRTVLMHITVLGKGYAKKLIEQSHTLTTYARDL